MLKFFWFVSLERRLGDPGWYDVLAPPVKQTSRNHHCRKVGLVQGRLMAPDLGVIWDSLSPNSPHCLSQDLGFTIELLWV